MGCADTASRSKQTSHATFHLPDAAKNFACQPGRRSGNWSFLLLGLNGLRLLLQLGDLLLKRLFGGTATLSRSRIVSKRLRGNCRRTSLAIWLAVDRLTRIRRPAAHA